MNYPFWEVPFIGSGWVIGIIAIFHTMISQFAVGGGMYLPFAERKAMREGRKNWKPKIIEHSKFFLIITGVYGTISGVGIWFAIGLAHPEATSTLIHNFVFGWAIEWVFFIIELSCAAVYYYTWDKIPDELHLKVGWLYAGTSLCTLIIINGILTFMLTPGDSWLAVAGTGQESSRFWNAFFNPTYWPSLVLRSLVCTSLAGVWALVSFSKIDGDKEGRTKTELIRWSCTWLFPAFLLMPIAFIWYLSNVPETNRQLLTFGIATIGQGTFTLVTRVVFISVMSSATILAIVYFLAYRTPREFTRGYALSVLWIALLATGATEHARESIRKPFVINSHMYANGVRVSEVAQYNEKGYLSNSPWVTDKEKEEMQHAMSAATLTQAERVECGQLVFRGQCMACHTLTGYRAMTPLVKGRDRASLQNLLKMLHDHAPDSPYRAFMPPLVGLPAEQDALVEYLLTLNPGPAAKVATTASTQH